MYLITGGCGYIGSHIAYQILKENKNSKIIILDNLSTGVLGNIKNIEKFFNVSIKFYKGDIRNRTLVKKILNQNKVTTLIHLAGMKSISESLIKLEDYYECNVKGSIVLLSEIFKSGVNNILFSSSATVYGSKNKTPYREDMLTYPESPYAISKKITEELLKSYSLKYKNSSIAILRYFNPIGLSPSGILKLSHKSDHNNLIPNLIRAFKEKEVKVEIYGNDYDTKDGTCVRDYIHIDDLVEGHTRALKYISNRNGFYIWNLGSQKGYSVLEVVNSFEKILKKKISKEISPRRNGDLDKFWSNCNKAKKQLNWKARKNLLHMLQDTWKYNNK